MVLKALKHRKFVILLTIRTKVNMKAFFITMIVRNSLGNPDSCFVIQHPRNLVPNLELILVVLNIKFNHN